MEVFTLENTFSQNSLTSYVVPKYVETRGFIYILQDKAFPEFFKIGRTADMLKRLAEYNSDKPYPSTYLTHISKCFADVISVEKKILEYLYKTTSPTAFKLEWFEIAQLPLAIQLLEDAEDYFPLYTIV